MRHTERGIEHEWGMASARCLRGGWGVLSSTPPVYLSSWLRARAQSTFLAGLLRDARLAAFRADGTLEIVLWEGTAECGKGARLKCWQPVLYSHAVLAAWGTDAYLSLADHDEYLALPAGGPTRSVQDLIAICGGFDSQVAPFCSPQRCCEKRSTRGVGGGGLICTGRIAVFNPALRLFSLIGKMADACAVPQVAQPISVCTGGGRVSVTGECPRRYAAAQSPGTWHALRLRPHRGVGAGQHPALRRVPRVRDVQWH